MSFRRPRRRTSPAARRHLPRILGMGAAISYGHQRWCIEYQPPEGGELVTCYGDTLPRAVAVWRGHDRYADRSWVPGEESSASYRGTPGVGWLRSAARRRVRSAPATIHRDDW